jgi:hypothetical protein
MTITSPNPAAMFAVDVVDHEMTVLRDSDLYRHIRFRRPGTVIYGFDLVTWPGYLAIAGDMGDLVFSRTADMVGFFRSGPGINPGYWAEKVRATGTPVREYSEALLVRQVTEEFCEHAHELGWPLAKVRDLWVAIDTEVLRGRDEDEDEARRAVRDFHDDHPDLFFDSWEWELQDFSYRYLYLCHAVRWGCEYYATGTKPAMPAPPAPRAPLPTHPHLIDLATRAAAGIVTAAPQERYL